MPAPAFLCEMIACSISYQDHDGWLQVIEDVSLQIRRGEVLGLVGESGCGKSTVAMQFLGYRARGSRVDRGKVLFEGEDLLSLDQQRLGTLRGRRIGFVPQNPTTALNPAITVGRQITEVLLRHRRASGAKAAVDRTLELFSLVGLPEPRVTIEKYPHQLSGGQQQRVCIAMALACEPSLVVMDEPTTGLDVTTQRQIIDLLIDLRRRTELSLLYVTHDLALLSQIADRVGVMYAGSLVETAPVRQLFFEPAHPYTRGLLASAPKLFSSAAPGPHSERLRGMLQRSALPPGCPFEPRCRWSAPECATGKQHLDVIAPAHEVACQRWRAVAADDGIAASESREPATQQTGHRSARPVLTLDNVTIAYPGTGLFGRRKRPFKAVRSLQLSIGEGEIVALVGESGSGKSTIARAIAGLIEPSEGSIAFEGRLMAGTIDRRSPDERRRLQFIFQNPDASLNPRKRIDEIVRRPAEILLGLTRAAAARRVMDSLAATRLDEKYAVRFPDQLSGGERQRVAIARALVADPSVLICDEILSALDVSVQSSITDLLGELRRNRQVSMLFISHDLAVVRDLADRVAVLFRGELMQLGRTADVYAAPYHPYTYSLLKAVPRPGVVTSHRADITAKSLPATGEAACVFAGRCPWQPGEVCVQRAPPLRQTAQGALIRCHLPLDELTTRGLDLSESLLDRTINSASRNPGTAT